MSYIIKNCRAIKEQTLLLTSDPPQIKENYFCRSHVCKICEDIEDCLLKKLLKECQTATDSKLAKKLLAMAEIIER